MHIFLPMVIGILSLLSVCLFVCLVHISETDEWICLKFDI